MACIASRQIGDGILTSLGKKTSIYTNVFPAGLSLTEGSEFFLLYELREILTLVPRKIFADLHICGIIINATK